MRVPFTGLLAQHKALEAELVPHVLNLAAAQTFILGEPVARFEEALSELLRARHAIGVASGTDALVLSLRALGIGPGDCVVVPAFGFVATAEAVALVGARPLFADVKGFHLDADGVLAALARGRDRELGRVRAILPVHLFGECAPMDGILEVAERHGLFVIEDAAQAILATDRDRFAGTMGALGAFSFFPTKNLGGWGDGGAVVSSDADYAARVRRLRQHGMERGQSLEMGTNSRLDALQATVLDVKAKHLESWTKARERIAAIYRLELGHEAQVECPPPPRDECRHVYHQFVIRISDPDALAVFLNVRGIETRRYYARPLPEEPAFAKMRDDARFPRAEDASWRSLGLPIYPELTEEAQSYVIEAVRDFCERA